MSKSVREPLTKEGRHGTLYRYEIEYSDEVNGNDLMFRSTWRCWAYDSEHAIDKFCEAEDGEGWRLISWRRLTEGAQHRNPRHDIGIET